MFTIEISPMVVIIVAVLLVVSLFIFAARNPANAIAQRILKLQSGGCGCDKGFMCDGKCTVAAPVHTDAHNTSPLAPIAAPIASAAGAVQKFASMYSERPHIATRPNTRRNKPEEHFASEILAGDESKGHGLDYVDSISEKNINSEMKSHHKKYLQDKPSYSRQAAIPDSTIETTLVPYTGFARRSNVRVRADAYQIPGVDVASYATAPSINF